MTSRIFLLSLIILITIPSIYQIVELSQGRGMLSTYAPWRGWIAVITMSLANPLIVLSSTRMGRKNRKFYGPSLGMNLLRVFYFLMLALWYQVLRVLIIIFLVTKSFVQWDKNKKGETVKSLDPLIVVMLLSGIVIIGLSMGYLMSLVPESSKWANPTPYLDSFGVLLIITGVYLLTSHYKQAFIFFYISKVIMSIMFISLGQWSSLVTIVAFAFIIDPMSLMTWEIRWRKQQLVK